MKNFCDVDVHNIDKYYDRPDGNLYYKPEEGDYEVVDGFSVDELKAALVHGDIEMIWISGPCLEKLSEVLSNE